MLCFYSVIETQMENVIKLGAVITLLFLIKSN